MDLMGEYARFWAGWSALLTFVGAPVVGAGAYYLRRYRLRRGGPLASMGWSAYEQRSRLKQASTGDAVIETRANIHAARMTSRVLLLGLFGWILSTFFLSTSDLVLLGLPGGGVEVKVDGLLLVVGLAAIGVGGSLLTLLALAFWQLGQTEQLVLALARKGSLTTGGADGSADA